MVAAFCAREWPQANSVASTTASKQETREQRILAVLRKTFEEPQIVAYQSGGIKLQALFSDPEDLDTIEDVMDVLENEFETHVTNDKVLALTWPQLVEYITNKLPR